MSGSGGSAQKQTFENKDPWAGVQPYLRDIFSQAQGLYQGGAGTNLWQGPTVAGLNPTMQEALGSSTDLARAMAGSGATTSPYISALTAIGSNGMTPDMYPALGTLGGVASGQNAINTGGMYGDLFTRSLAQNQNPNQVMAALANRNPITTAGAFGNLANLSLGNNASLLGQIGQIGSGANGITVGNQIQDLFNRTRTQNYGPQNVLGSVALGGNTIGTGGQFQDVANRAAGPTSSGANLADIAAGRDINNNPFLTQLLDANAARIGNRVNSAMSGAGRYGSFGQADALARTINETNLPLLNANYEAERQRQLAANQQIDAAQRAAEASRMAGISGLTGVQGQNIANQMGAATGLANMRNADTALGANLLGQVGGFQGQNIGNQLAALGLGGNLGNANISNALQAISGQTGAQGQNAAARLAAATGLAGSNRADIAGALGATQGLTGTQQQNIANQMGAASGLLGALQTGQGQALNWAQLAPQLNALAYDPSQRLGAAGSYLQGRSQQELDAQRQLYEQAQNMPWTQLSRYLGGVSGLGGIVGQAGTTQGTTNINSNAGLTDYLRAFGGGNNSIVSGLGSFGSSLLGSAGTGGVGGSGVLGLLGMLSDREAKTDIKKLGTNLDTGLDIFAYRYKGDPKTYPKVVGPMAQDIEAKYPGSTDVQDGKMFVKPHALGLLAV